MGQLIVAFFGLYLGISGTPLRAVLRNSLGEALYFGVYLLLSFGSLSAMIYGYVGVSGDDCDGCPGKNPTGVMSDEALDH